MTEENKALEVSKEELPVETGEQTRECPCFIPKADIYETEEVMTILMDMPGVHENAVDILLEKNVLSIRGYLEPSSLDGFALAFAEYEAGDYSRQFTLSSDYDVEEIDAQLTDGVLEITLPKVAPAKRKISVKSA